MADACGDIAPPSTLLLALEPRGLFRAWLPILHARRGDLIGAATIRTDCRSWDLTSRRWRDCQGERRWRSFRTRDLFPEPGALEAVIDHAA